MRIPARFAAHEIAVHRFVTWNKVFHRARHGVPDVRQTVSRGRPLVKHVAGATFAHGLGGLEDLLPSPKLENIVLHRREIYFTCHFFKHKMTSLNTKNPHSIRNGGLPAVPSLLAHTGPNSMR